MGFQIKVFLYVLISINLVYAYPSGAPEDVCEDLVPKHKVTPQTSESPYEVTATLQNSPNQANEVEINIKSPGGTPFRGFIIQARLATDQNSTVDGKFKVMDELNSHAVSCSGAVNNTLTHSNRNDKKMISAKWLPPQNFNKEVIFVASIVKDKKTFWVNQLSKGIDYLSVSQDPKANEHGNHHGNDHGNSHDHDHGQKNEVSTTRTDSLGGVGNQQLNSSSTICLNLLTLFTVILMPFI